MEDPRKGYVDGPASSEALLTAKKQPPKWTITVDYPTIEESNSAKEFGLALAARLAGHATTFMIPVAPGGIKMSAKELLWYSSPTSTPYIHTEGKTFSSFSHALQAYKRVYERESMEKYIWICGGQSAEHEIFVYANDWDFATGFNHAIKLLPGKCWIRAMRAQAGDVANL